MRDDEALSPGTVFAGYEVVRLLGEGGFGAVYEAVYRGTALGASAPSPGGSPNPSDAGRTRAVALKVLRAEVAGNEEVVLRFLREAQAVGELRHPNIVEAVEVGEHAGRPFLAMELLVGEALADRVARDGRLSLPAALDILLPVMSAMRVVHAQGVVHRDLKPDNVFLTYAPDGSVHPKVLDFGFAKMARAGMQITRNDTTIGTPNFMSPEQMHSPLAVDPRSDQWALGVLLYYLLTGVKPFAGASVVETLKNVLHNHPAPLRAYRPDVPEEVEAVVERALRKHPDERFGSVHEMAAALVPFAGDEAALVYTAEFCGEALWDESEAEATNPAMASAPPAPPQNAYAFAAPPESPSLPPVSLAPRASSEPARRSRPLLVLLGALGLGALVAGGLWALDALSSQPRTTTHAITPAEGR